MPDAPVLTPPAPPVSVRTLLCHRDLPLAVNCLQTLRLCCADPISLVVHDDGSLTTKDEAVLRETWPGCRVLRRAEADAPMHEALAKHPHARAFRAQSIWGLKLLDVALAEPGDCYYIDGDIRFFRPFRGLFRREALAGRSVFLRDTVWTAYSVRPWHLLDSRRLRLVEGINTGLTLIDRACYDLDFVNWFLSQPDWRVIPAWTEPTCWAALAARTRGHAIKPAQLPNLYPQSQVTTETVGAHFLSSYRHGFLPELSRKTGLSLPVTTIQLKRLSLLGPLGLGWNQLTRKINNRRTLAKSRPAAQHPR